MERVDVFIVGGGPAGAACATRLRAAGVECLVLDKAAFPHQKVCAGWITPDVFSALGTHADTYPHGIQHFDRFDVSIKKMRFRPRVNQYAIRRMEFDAWLLEQSGAQVKQRHVREITTKTDGYVIDGDYSAKYLVGAGGTQCPVRRSLFGDYPRRKEDLIVAMEDELIVKEADSHCRLWFFREGLPGYGWYVPKSDGYVNVGVGGKAKGMGAMGVTIHDYWERLTSWLEADGLLEGVSLDPQGWHYYIRGQRPTLRIGNAMIIGDSAGLATRDMGEGIRAAVLSGIAAANAIIEDGAYSIRSIPIYSFPSLLSK